jgi:hypothetical protein
MTLRPNCRALRQALRFSVCASPGAVCLRLGITYFSSASDGAKFKVFHDIMHIKGKIQLEALALWRIADPRRLHRTSTCAVEQAARAVAGRVLRAAVKSQPMRTADTTRSTGIVMPTLCRSDLESCLRRPQFICRPAADACGCNGRPTGAARRGCKRRPPRA